MRIQTTRFGEIEVDDTAIIAFPEGIIGFPGIIQYVMLEHSNGPYRWLQSVDEAGLAFVIINPALIVEDYYIDLRDEDLAILQFSSAESMENDLAVAVILNFSTLNPSANLLAPLCFNVARRVGCQVVLHTSGYTTRHQLVLEPKKDDENSEDESTEGKDAHNVSAES